jgi:ATP adenylyltransferase
VSLEHLWAGWRSAYVTGVDADVAPDLGEQGCLFCGLFAMSPGDSQVIHRGDLTCALVNAFPYTSGHLMVAPLRHLADLESLEPSEAVELMAMARSASIALKTAYRPDGINVGINMGRAAGAGVPGHLHVHVLPRWFGDTNFMTTVAEARVLPEALEVTLERLRAAWPA